MALVTDKPQDIPSGNDLDQVPDDLLDIPPAYLTFSHTPAPLEDPPAQGDVETYLIRARCTAEHGPIERKDGEMRYTRTMAIQAIWKPGQQPPSTDEDQPGLLDHDGNIDPDAVADETDEDYDDLDHDGEDGDAAQDDGPNPAFSHNSGE